METLGIHTSAMLVELNVSCWTARKLDRRVSEEVDANKATKARAGNYNKNLLAGTEILDSMFGVLCGLRLFSFEAGFCEKFPARCNKVTENGL